MARTVRALAAGASFRRLINRIHGIDADDPDVVAMSEVVMDMVEINDRLDADLPPAMTTLLTRTSAIKAKTDLIVG